MASRKASRTVMVAISVPAGKSSSGKISSFGGAAAGAVGAMVGLMVTACFCWPAVPASPTGPAASPSARMVAIGVLTATSLVPSGTRIFPSTPSSIASTSMVALSVSISAMTSPGFTGSPSCFSHLARLPFSIVGDKAGIKTWMGMGLLEPGARLLHDVGIELGRIRLGVVGGELRCLIDDGAQLGVDLLQLVFGRP